MPSPSNTLRVLHFNDVYHVGAGNKEPVGGAARFGSLLHSLQRDTSAGPTLTLFSGDAYFPSLESSISRGEHMLPVLNQLNIDASTLGNHEFDQGIDLLEGLIKRNNFPWVITNLTDGKTGNPAAKGSLKYLIKEIDGLRVGIIGIIEKEWLDTLPCLPPTFEYHDFVIAAKEMATKLKSQSDKTMGCDLVICLSHMRLNNDIKLAEECADVIDLVLSGHDHFYYIGSGIDVYDDPDLNQLPEKYSGHDDDTAMLATWKSERAQLPPNSQGKRLVKSGTDFRDLSEIMLELDRSNPDKVHINKISVKRHRTTSRVVEDQEIRGMVDRIEAHLSKALDKIIGISTTDLDARSTVCRTQESNYGSLSGDLMRLCYAESAGAQIAFLCGGAIRSDKVFPAGEISMRNIMEVFPFEDPVVVVRLTGDQIRRALENGVSKWPAQEGRFPQVSGIRFEFDPQRAPGDPESDYGDEENEELDMNTYYNVATRDYMYQGHDGYEALNEGELIVDEENGITFSNLYRRYFYGLAVCNALR
ncbi:Metallo-dependent phosphatase, partial [Coemansia reversa NRRL 1564]